MARLPRPGYRRHPGDALRVALGGAVLALTTVAIHRNFVGDRRRPCSGSSTSWPFPTGPGRGCGWSCSWG
jgi:hypothetical protein